MGFGQHEDKKGNKGKKDREGEGLMIVVKSKQVLRLFYEKSEAMRVKKKPVK